MMNPPTSADRCIKPFRHRNCKASCHCGAVRWKAPEPTELHTCNCSYCDRTGAIWTSVPEAEFELVSMPERVAGYQFGSYMVRHYHCAICGMATHGWSPSFSQDGKADFDKPLIGWNVRMAPGFDRWRFEIAEHDGKRY